jgi:hypothetical protein
MTREFAICGFHIDNSDVFFQKLGDGKANFTYLMKMIDYGFNVVFAKKTVIDNEVENHMTWLQNTIDNLDVQYTSKQVVCVFIIDHQGKLEGRTIKSVTAYAMLQSILKNTIT